MMIRQEPGARSLARYPALQPDRSCTSKELLDCGLDELVQQALADHAAVNHRGDALDGREEDDPDSLGIAGVQSTQLLSLLDEFDHRSERGFGGLGYANLLFIAELHRRLSLAGSAVIATAAHPGISATNLMSSEDRGLRFRVEKALMSLVAQSQEAGALPTLYAATADIPGNSFAGPGRLMGLPGAPKLVNPAAKARDAAVARRLWDASEKLTGVTFPLTAQHVSWTPCPPRHESQHLRHHM